MSGVMFSASFAGVVSYQAVVVLRCSVTAYWSVSDRLSLRFGVGLRFVPDSCSSG